MFKIFQNSLLINCLVDYAVLLATFKQCALHVFLVNLTRSASNCGRNQLHFDQKDNYPPLRWKQPGDPIQT